MKINNLVVILIPSAREKNLTEKCYDLRNLKGRTGMISWFGLFTLKGWFSVEF